MVEFTSLDQHFKIFIGDPHTGVGKYLVGKCGGIYIIRSVFQGILLGTLMQGCTDFLVKECAGIYII